MLIQNDKILVIFQYLQAKILQCSFKVRKQLINIWMVSSSKKLRTFCLCSFTMLQERSLLKLTEYSELNTKITLKTWSFQARRQDSVTGGGGGHGKFIHVDSRGARGHEKFIPAQARSQDLEKGSFFERVRKVQTTLTRIFIVLESVSHGLSEN